VAVVLRQKIGSQNTHYVHGLSGIQSQVANSVWHDAVSDGLGSVRGWLDGAGAFVDTMGYNPYGVPDGAVDGFGFTGEMTDANDLVYLRARHYAPSIGSFVSLDPFEGKTYTPMSLNGYSWVEGNVANWNDPSGKSIELATRLNTFTCNNIPMQPTPSRNCSCYDNTIRNVPIVIGNIVYVTPREACEYGYSYTYPECLELTPTVTPPEPYIIFFGGSQGNGNLNLQGPLPTCQTPVWYDIANQPLRYPGTQNLVCHNR